VLIDVPIKIKFELKITLFSFKVKSVQLDHLNIEKADTKRKRSSHLSPDEIPDRNRSVSRSSSTGTIQDEIQDTLHSLLRKQKELEHDQKVTDDWRAMATKIDKILFYVFLILTVVSTLGLLVVAPLFRSNVQRKIKLWNGSRRP
jgi:Flp pilus assembly protein TadB